VPGVRHNSILSGFIDTPIINRYYGKEGAKLAHVVAQEITPAGRMGTATDIANTALFLASDQATIYQWRLHLGGWWG
jgi:NAD(P)-dependent dehydrogenase (short-subunit alcohol dehydrogenase family)